MATVQQGAEPDIPAHTSLITRSQFRGFLLAIFVAAVVLYLGTFALVRLAGLGYVSSRFSRWGPVLDYPFQVKGLDADVVIFGDSTAFLGIDPRIVNTDLGVPSVVLPNTLGSLPVTNDLPLKAYLEQNKKPRLIVFYFAPWNLDYLHHNQQRLYFEGIETLIRNGRWGALAAFAVHHPLDVLAFPMQIQSTIDIRNLKAALRGGNTGDLRSTFGHRDYKEPWPAVAANCQIPNKYVDQTAALSVQTLVETYRKQGYNVVLYLAPVPACTNVETITNRSYRGLALSPPATLPPSSYAQDDFYGHLWPSAVPSASHLLSQSLRTSVPSLFPAAPDPANPALPH